MLILYLLKTNKWSEVTVTSHSLPEYWSGWPFPSPGDLPNPEIKSRSPTLQVDSLPAEPQGKPKNTGVGSLSLLQWIFLTQESNRSLPHCRWILYQLRYQGSQIGKIHLIIATAFLRKSWWFALKALRRESENVIWSVMSNSLRPQGL